MPVRHMILGHNPEAIYNVNIGIDGKQTIIQETHCDNERTFLVCNALMLIPYGSSHIKVMHDAYIQTNIKHMH